MLADPPVQTEPIPQFPVCICYILCWSHPLCHLDRNTVSTDRDMLWYFKGVEKFSKLEILSKGP